MSVLFKEYLYKFLSFSNIYCLYNHFRDEYNWLKVFVCKVYCSSNENRFKYFIHITYIIINFEILIFKAFIESLNNEPLIYGCDQIVTVIRGVDSMLPFPSSAFLFSWHLSNYLFYFINIRHAKCVRIPFWISWVIFYKTVLHSKICMAVCCYMK